MKIIKTTDKQWVDMQGSYSKKVLLNDEELKHKGVFVQEVKIKPGETAKEHYHKKQTEIFYFLSENGYWVINGEKVTFKIGEILVIEPFDKHEVTNNTAQDYTYLGFKLDYDSSDLYWE